MTWTTFSDVKAQVQKLWDRGRILSPLAGGEDLFPLRLILKGPSSSELSERFDEVRIWIEKLRKEEGRYRIVYREVRHRIIGANSVPAEIWIDGLENAISIIGKKKECTRFRGIVELVARTHPELMEWIRKRPLNALEFCDVLPRLLDVVSWTRNNPRPGIYLRQIDIPGIHTKFIESHRAVLSELLDMALPSGIIDLDAKGVANFCQRYGFRQHCPA